MWGCNAKESVTWSALQHIVTLCTCMNLGCCSLEYTITPLKRPPAIFAGQPTHACSWYGPVAGHRRRPSWSRQCTQRTQHKQPADYGVGQQNTHEQCLGGCTVTKERYSALSAPYQRWPRQLGRRPQYQSTPLSDDNSTWASGNGGSSPYGGKKHSSSHGVRPLRRACGDLRPTRMGHSRQLCRAATSATMIKS